MHDLLAQVLDAATDGAFEVDENQTIIYWNRAAEQILGYSADDVIGKPCFTVLCGFDDAGTVICQRHCRVSTDVFSGRSVYSYDLAARSKTNDVCWINISILTLPSITPGARPTIIHLFRDATQTKQNEQFVRQIFALADQEVKRPPPKPPPKTTHDPLTPREQEILNLLAQGYSTREISNLLSLSSSTVRNHVQKVLHKLHVHSRLEAVAYAYKHGLISGN